MDTRCQSPPKPALPDKPFDYVLFLYQMLNQWKDFAYSEKQAKKDNVLWNT